MKYICTICGEVIESDTMPEVCPVCGATTFEEMKEGEKNYADEHRVGVAKGLDEEVVEGLRANFTGECCEVGMYLAMSRQAEAEHAAKFAELLGEVLTDSTAKNVAMRAEAEFGACAGKLAIAKRAKQLGYDAIHDTVHEMCKDEARHGKGFDGLLKRYFSK